MPRFTTSGASLRDPRVDILLEDIERHRSAHQHDIVEGADVEAGTERLAGALAQLDDLQLADGVGGRLAGIDDEALDLVDDIAARHGRVSEVPVDRLLPRPALRVDARIGHQPPGTQNLHAQPAEIRIGIGVEPHLFAELFGIETPTFRIRDYPAETAEGGNLAERVLDRPLEVMPGDALVISERLDLVPRHCLEVVEIDVINARARTVRGGG